MLTFKDIAKIFEEIELRLIASLKRNLGRHKQWEQDEDFRWSAWHAEKLRNVEKFRRENAVIMSEYAPMIDDETRQLMEAQFAEGEKLAEETVSEAVGNIAQLERQPAFFGVDRTKLDNLIQEVTTLEKNVETAALRMTDDVYRQTLNRVQLSMASGEMPLNKAIDLAVKDFLDKGINCIVYKNGRRVNIADYVRMALRTTSTRAQFQGKAKRAHELGYDTVAVSQYGMCSDTCLPWQGRVYIDDVFFAWEGERSGDRGKSNYCGKWFPLLSSAVRGGLFHPNCRHTMTVWIDGVNEIPEPLDEKTVRERSKLEQKQRQLENDVRKAKRRAEGFSDPEDVKKAAKEVHDAQRRLKEFVDDHSDVLRRDYSREKIYSAGIPESAPEVSKSGATASPGQLIDGHSVDVRVQDSTTNGGTGKLYEPEKIPDKAVDISDESGIIKSIDIDDFEMMSEGKGIDPKAIETISSVIRKYEKSGDIYINDFYFGSLASEKNGTPLLQIEPIADKTLRLNINTDIFSRKTVAEIDEMLKSCDKNLAVSLEEAVIHECGHAKSLKGLKINEIENLYDEIANAEIKEISDIAYQDGAEALAEIEILISRGSDIPKEAIDFYNKYMRRK